MAKLLHLWLLLGIALATSLAACGDSAGVPTTAGASYVTVPIGEAGGSFAGPNGAGVVVPPGALRGATPMSIGLPPVGSNPALPPGLAPVGATYVITPRGTRFGSPVVVAIPFDPAQVPKGARLRLLHTTGEFDAGWSELAGATPNGNVMQAAAETAASFVVVVRLELP